ncbi:hypothetical protein J6590_028030 [Homalodisca vitripennis]|nr:hypothetical protein J6590_023566 [Homalodisca vitripennis]KAG8337240.1 hypothetical protein J6590_028030 [Homalodisca vitripennis]
MHESELKKTHTTPLVAMEETCNKWWSVPTLAHLTQMDPGNFLQNDMDGPISVGGELACCNKPEINC